MVFDFHPRRGFIAQVKPMINPNGKTQTIYDNFFTIKGAKLWNILPKNINIITASLNSFKDALANFLNLFPDRPPVEGYSRANDNSLLSWWLALSADCNFIQQIREL